MTTILKDGNRALPFDEPRLRRFLSTKLAKYPELDGTYYVEKCMAGIAGKETYTADAVTNLLILNAMDYIGVNEGQHPNWTHLAADIYLDKLYKLAARNRSYDATRKYGDFYGLIKTLASLGIYDGKLLRDYSHDEINELAKLIDPERDHLLTYIGIRTLSDRYLATDRDRNVYELPQERWLIIAMTLMREEPRHKRLEFVTEAYWALSNLYMTVATPTLANAGKNPDASGQMSSCFIDTVDDSLRGIYENNTDMARLSKMGGGLGIAMTKVRARASSIKGFKGIGSGVVPWIKQLNNTAVSVDQLGTRGGAIAVYLDVWHKDVLSFLDLRLNNGDERARAHDVFLGLAICDLFMEQVEKRGEWYLFDPHEVRQVMGWSLEDCYDEKRGSGTFRYRYEQCVNHPTLSRERIQAVDIMKRAMKSQLEAGLPYMVYKDEANRKNPNKHAGMIYCSNLCTEIFQNMSATTVISEEVENGEIIVRKKPGDFVVCNLSSITLGRAYNVLERLIRIQVRMLDNVIDLNNIDVLQAQITNHKYRAVGLGVSDWHHLLAIKKIRWESDEAVEFADKLFEDISYFTIKTSMELANEKGAYPMFKGSDWYTGNYFTDREYVTDIELETESDNRWAILAKDIRANGIRNGYLMAVAPTMSTGLISGATAGIDPVFKRTYVEEKKDYKIPVTAPDLSTETFWYYKNAFEVDQVWSIKQNAARQRHVDQGISFNLYVENDIKASALLSLHLEAWKSGLKSTYYVRSTAIGNNSDCESCSS